MVDCAYTIGETYRDIGSYRDPDDQFLRWIRGPLDSGIKNTGGIRGLGAKHSDRPAALVLISNDKGVSRYDDPWEDTLAVDAGYVSYWGNTKADNPYDESTQNQKIRAVFNQAATGRREAVPPVLVFRKPEAGVVQFCGLCVPDYFEVRPYEDDSGTHVPNYLFHFSILNTQSVPVSWLHARAQHNSAEQAPAAQTAWTRTGTAQQWPTGEPLPQTGGQLRRYERSETVVSDRFRAATLERFDHACPLTGIEADPLLDLAHILPRSDRPELAEHPENVLVLNSLHHRAFDAGLFTLDTDYRIRVSPTFDPGHPFLQETLVERAHEPLSLPSDVRPRPGFFEELNADLGWL